MKDYNQQRLLSLIEDKERLEHTMVHYGNLFDSGKLTADEFEQCIADMELELELIQKDINNTLESIAMCEDDATEEQCDTDNIVYDQSEDGLPF